MRLDPARLMRRVEQGMSRVLEGGKQDMRAYIEARGTGRTWQHPWGGRTGSYPGRVDSGDMLNDVEGRVVASDANGVTGVLGWAEGSPSYYRHQEHGFHNTLTDTDVEGMRAFADAEADTTEALLDELLDIAKEL